VLRGANDTRARTSFNFDAMLFWKALGFTDVEWGLSVQDTLLKTPHPVAGTFVISSSS
jgi:hypothetical protein